MRRTLLARIFAASVVVSLCAAAVPFARSLFPSQRAKAEYELRVEISGLSSHVARLVEWNGSKIFLTTANGLTVLYMPFSHGAFRLPDFTWERPVVPCREFAFVDAQFQCLDADLFWWWRDNARWDAAGQSLSGVFPNMMSPPYSYDGTHAIILGRRQ